MAEEIIGVKVQVDGSQATQSLGGIRKEIKAANAELINAQKTFGDYSAEALAAAKKVATLKDSIAEAAETANLFDPGKKFQAFSGALSAVAGGFAAVQGAVGLLGVESEAVEKSILKVQSALALSQGLSTIKDSAKDFQRLGAIIQSTTAFQKINNTVTALTGTIMKSLGVAVETTSTSFRVLKGAIAATGIGLLVVAVGELVSAFQNYTSAAEKAKKAQDDLNESANKGAKIAYDTEIAFIEKQKQLDVAKAKNKGASEQEIFNIEQSASRRKIESQKRFIAASRGITVEDQIQQQRDLEKQQNDIEVSELNFQTSQNEKKKQQKEKEKKEREDKKKQDDADRKARKEQEFNDFVQFVNDLKSSTDAELELQEFLISEQKRKEQELFDWQVKLAQDKYDSEEAGFLLMQDLNKKSIENEQKALDAKVAIQMAEIDLVFQLAGVLKQVAGKNKAIQAAAIIAENAAGIGRIIINTQVANAKAAAASPLTLGQPWVTINTISGALGVASSLLATRKALSELGGGNAGSAPSIGGRTGGSAPLAPSEPQAQLTQLNQASINQMGSATGRAYVVESDITNSQEKITRINRAARLG